MVGRKESLAVYRLGLKSSRQSAWAFSSRNGGEEEVGGGVQRILQSVDCASYMVAQHSVSHDPGAS